MKQVLSILFTITGMIASPACHSQSPTSGMVGFKAEPVGRYETGIKNASATEVVVYDPATQSLFSTNSASRTIDVIDISDPSKPEKKFAIDLTPYGNKANSISLYGNVLAAAVEDTFPQRNGRVVFFDTKGKYIAGTNVGSMPDMLTFTPDGEKVIVANEGEPTDNYAFDPPGSVSVVDLSKGIKQVMSITVSFKDLSEQPGMKRLPGVASFEHDLEPEYITVAPDSKKAWVVMQENNAIAEIDLEKNRITKFWGLGFKDHSTPGNGIDASDKTEHIHVKSWPVKGMYQPDAITSFSMNGLVYLVTANEGDKRDYNINEAVRVSALPLDTIAFPNHAELKSDMNLGRLLVSRLMGDTDNDGDLDALYAFGGRSFSIWDTSGKLVFDSGDAFEQILSGNYLDDPQLKKRFKKRCDDRGPEPEGLATGMINDELYLFVGLERMGGVIIYKINAVTSPEFVTYLQANDFSSITDIAENDENETDLNPEGLLFIPAEKTNSGKHLLVVANEVSGTITIYGITVN